MKNLLTVNQPCVEFDDEAGLKTYAVTADIPLFHSGGGRSKTVSLLVFVCPCSRTLFRVIYHRIV